MQKYLFLGIIISTWIGLLQAQPIIIDNFTVSSTQTAREMIIPGSGMILPGPAVGPTPITTVISGQIIGNTRTVTNVITAVTSSSASADVTAGFGRLGLSNSVTVASTAKLHYDGNGATLGGIDLTNSGTQLGIALGLANIDHTSSQVTITVVSPSGTSTFNRTFTAADRNGASEFPFTGFTGSANFTQVNSITFDFVIPVNVDMSINGLATFGSTPPPPVVAQVPIPTMSEWGVLIFGLLVLNLGLILIYRKTSIVIRN